MWDEGEVALRQVIVKKDQGSGIIIQWDRDSRVFWGSLGGIQEAACDYKAR